MTAGSDERSEDARKNANAGGLTRCREALERMLRAFTGQHTNGQSDALEKRAAVAQARATLSGATPPQEGSSMADRGGPADADTTGEVK